MERLHILIFGKVIDVGFRSFVKYHADLLNVKGYVQNKGREVELVLEGNPESLKQLIAICRKGPPRSRVIKINIEKEDFKNEFNTFEIRY